MLCQRIIKNCSTESTALRQEAYIALFRHFTGKRSIKVDKRIGVDNAKTVWTYYRHVVLFSDLSELLFPLQSLFPDFFKTGRNDDHSFYSFLSALLKCKMTNRAWKNNDCQINLIRNIHYILICLNRTNRFFTRTYRKYNTRKLCFQNVE